MTVRPVKIVASIVVIVVLLLVGAGFHYSYIINPGVVAELKSEPNGERAKRVMLLALPDGNMIPVNYLQEGQSVFVGADGRWWREFRDNGKEIEILLKGATLSGHAVAITNDPEYRDEVFARLRPTAPTWLPEWMKGVLMKITVAEAP
ncbi:MAG: hypothetical protein ACFHX7_18360 [Pseudomonadota bacterium]